MTVQLQYFPTYTVQLIWSQKAITITIVNLEARKITKLDITGLGQIPGVFKVRETFYSAVF